MSEKKNKTWLQKISEKAKKIITSPKTLIPALLMAGSSLSASAAGNSPDSPEKPLTETIAAPVTNTEFKAYPGEYYNQKCNGSPCWLSSTFETNGAGEGPKKNLSSIAVFSANGLYRGINQMDINHSKRFVKWLKDKEQFSPIYKMLSQGGVGKANWQNTAKKYEHLMTLANEQYMVQEYNPANFGKIQKILNNHQLPVSVKKFHPAILSCIHKMTVQSPAASQRIALKTVKFLNDHGNDVESLNSEDYIRHISTSAALSKATIKLMNDSTVQWNVSQFDDLLSQVTPEYTDNQSWFDGKGEAREDLAKIEKQQKEDMEKVIQLTAADFSKAIRADIPDLSIKLEDVKLRLKEQKQTDKKKNITQTEKQSRRRPKNLAQVIARRTRQKNEMG